MSYSVNALTTVADCDVLLSLANQQKSQLLNHKSNLNFQKGNNAISAVELETELLSVNAELAYVNGVLPTLPEGTFKEDQIVKQSKLIWRQKLLNNKKADYGSIALLEKEFELSRIELELTEADAFIADITTRRAAI